MPKGEPIYIYGYLNQLWIDIVVFNVLYKYLDPDLKPK